MPPDRPKIEMLKAVEVATEHAGKEINLKNYFIDRVWLAELAGENGKRWIVSWCADRGAEEKGWHIVLVDMDGRPSRPTKGVEWIDYGTRELLRLRNAENVK